MAGLPVQRKLPLPGFCESGKFAPYVDPLESDLVGRRCHTSGLGSITCQNPDLEKYIEDADGLDMLSIKSSGLTPQDPSVFPHFIPLVDKRAFNFRALPTDQEFVGISLRDIFLRQPPSSRSGCFEIKHFSPLVPNLDALPFFRGKKLILFLSGQDLLIESLWTQSYLINFYNELAKLGIYAVVAFNFSIFHGECPTFHALSLKKSLLSFGELQQAGIPAIPHVYWYSDHHLRRWKEWLEASPDVTMIGINCQRYQRHDDAIVARGMLELAEAFPQLHFLLEGSKEVFLKHVADLSGRMHILTKSPAMTAMVYRKFIPVGGKLKPVHRPNGNQARLLRENISTYEKWLTDRYFHASNVLTLPILLSKMKRTRTVHVSAK